VTTLFFLLLTLDAVGGRRWYILPLFLFNPMLFRTWIGVYQSGLVPRVSGSRGSVTAIATAVEKPAAEHWWTHYDTRRQNDEGRTSDRLMNGRR
jgi:hypothetical protein